MVKASVCSYFVYLFVAKVVNIHSMFHQLLSICKPSEACRALLWMHLIAVCTKNKGIGRTVSLLYSDSLWLHICYLFAGFYLGGLKSCKQVRRTERGTQDRDNNVYIWRSEVDQWEGTELRTQLSTDTRPPNLETLQRNLVKIFACLMPSRKEKGGQEESINERGLRKDSSRKNEG